MGNYVCCKKDANTLERPKDKTRYIRPVPNDSEFQASPIVSPTEVKSRILTYKDFKGFKMVDDIHSLYEMGSLLG